MKVCTWLSVFAFVLAIALTPTLFAAEEAVPPLPEKRPLSGYAGGPYKVIAADFTGDGIVDLALSYYPIDVVTIEQGDLHYHIIRKADVKPRQTHQPFRESPMPAAVPAEWHKQGFLC